MALVWHQDDQDQGWDMQTFLSPFCGAQNEVDEMVAGFMSIHFRISSRWKSAPFIFPLML